MRISFIGVSIIPLLLTTVSFGQAKEIAGQAFSDAIDSANRTVQEKPHRRTRTRETFSNGRVIQALEEVEEVQDKNTRRVIYTTKEGSRVTRKETVTVNGSDYTKANGGRWRKAKAASPAVNMTMIEGDWAEERLSTEQVILDSGPATLLRQYIVYKPLDNAAPNLKRVMDNRFWIDPSNRIVRREHMLGIRSGIFTSEIETFDYAPKLNITAPIK